MGDQAALAAPFADDACPGSVLLACLVELYGLEALDWDPGTWRFEIEADFGVEMLEACLHRLGAAVAIVKSDAFLTDLPRFVQLCNALADGRASSTVFDPAEPDEIAWSIAEASLLWPRREGEPDFVPAIEKYVARSLRDGGIYPPPEALRRLAPDLADPAGTGDDELDAAARKIAAARSAEIDERVRTGLQDLAARLKALPLEPEVGEAADRILGLLQRR